MLTRYLAAVLSLAMCADALCAPQSGTVKAGTASIATAGATTTITQTSDRAVIDWRSFDIATGETVRFAQPSAQSAILNRVTGSQMSVLQGSLTANGQVYLVNPNGILIGSGGSISAAAFVATTASIGNDAFMRAPADANGRYAFDQVTTASTTGSIVNLGTISVADGGLVALVAPSVRNNGAIVARLGTIELASASRFTLDLFGDDLVRFAIGDSISKAFTDVEGKVVSAQVTAAGTLTADGGRIVLLSVPAASGVVDQAINLSGVAQAASIATDQQGSIHLLANGGKIEVSGTADVSSAQSTVAAGVVEIIGSEVHLSAGALVTASSGLGGGQIVLGGRYTADGVTLTNSVQVDAGAAARACGTAACSVDGSDGSGVGGNVRLYSVNATTLAGEINVSGSATQSAGLVEVLSDSGLTTLAGTSTIVALSGVGQFSGFTAVIGNTLSVDASAGIDLRDYAGGFPLGASRLISDSTPGSTVRSYVFDDTLPQRQTSKSILFHAYSNNGYENSLPLLFDPILNPGSHLFAGGDTAETPIGTVRPNGGAPTTLAANAADPLTAIPVVFTPDLPPDVITPGGGVVNVQVSEASNEVSQMANRDGTATSTRRTTSESVGEIVTGGPGVARSADLGRSGDTAGAGSDVFGANFHVLGPAREGNDAQLSDYLCSTPYAGNACR